ncbi:MAG TPA: Na+/H+ antiporter subunit E [Acidimicrobiales bacterium]|jgi:multicomponent Na+:H+ antiporter subunit E|nr:Na+/H+ antiporter subunit E [Acidimicrobiales bacterium]
MRVGPGAAVWLVAVWVALWEGLSIANLLSGVLVVLVLSVVFPFRARKGTLRFRLGPALRLVAYFGRELVQANVVVAWEVLTPTSRINEGIVAVPVSASSKVLTTLVANAITLTPGTLTLEVRQDEGLLFVHVLHLHSIEAVRHDVARLERHVLRAFGSDEAIADVERRLAELDPSAPEAPQEGP